MARNPHKQGGLATAPPELDDDDPPADTPPADHVDHDDQDDDEPGDDEPDDDEQAAAGRSFTTPRVVDSGAGWLLGLLLWGWVIAPFVKGGPVAVKNVFKAKFLNKAPDGSELP